MCNCECGASMCTYEYCLVCVHVSMLSGICTCEYGLGMCTCEYNVGYAGGCGWRGRRGG